MLRLRLTVPLLTLSALCAHAAEVGPSTTSARNVCTASHGDRGAAIPVLYDYPVCYGSIWGDHWLVTPDMWLIFEVTEQPPGEGDNTLEIALLACNPMVDHAGIPVTVTDIELDVRYKWPNGGFRPKSWYPRDKQMEY